MLGLPGYFGERRCCYREGRHNDVRIQSQISNYLEILGHKDSRRTELPSGSRARWGFLNGSQGRHGDAEGSCHLLRLVHAGRTEPRALQDSDPREVGIIITCTPSLQRRKVRLEGTKTQVQGPKVKEVMGLESSPRHLCCHSHAFRCCSSLPSEQRTDFPFLPSSSKVGRWGYSCCRAFRRR